MFNLTYLEIFAIFQWLLLLQESVTRLQLFTRISYLSPPCPMSPPCQASCALPHTHCNAFAVQCREKCSKMYNPEQKCTLLSLLQRLQSFLCQVLQQSDILQSYIISNGFVWSANFLNMSSCLVDKF